jgi:hypothetical protein
MVVQKNSVTGLQMQSTENELLDTIHEMRIETFE